MILACNHYLIHYGVMVLATFKHERIWCICLRNTYVLGFQLSLMLIHYKHSRGENACPCAMEYYEVWVFQSSVNIWNTLSLSLSLSLSNLIHIHLRCEIAKWETCNESNWLCMFRLEQLNKSITLCHFSTFEPTFPTWSTITYPYTFHSQ